LKIQDGAQYFPSWPRTILHVKSVLILELNTVDLNDLGIFLHVLNGAGIMSYCYEAI